MSRTSGYGHIKNVVSSIKFVHEALNMHFLDDDFQVGITLQSLKRKLARTPFQVLPITAEILCKLYLFVDINKPQDLAVWSSFLVGFYCLYRKKSLVPVSLDQFDSDKELSRQKIMICCEEQIILVYSNFSKTNQFMNKNIVTPLLKNNVLALDPYYHIKKLFDDFNLDDTLPAFSYLECGKVHCVTYGSFTKRLKQLLDAAGYTPELFSGHSLRRGGATFLFLLGCDPLLIQATGDWKSSCFLMYLGMSFEQRWKAQSMMTSYVPQ